MHAKWVTGAWAEQRGLEVRAAVGMFKAKIMQVVSVRLMQVTANACIFHRVRGAINLATTQQGSGGSSRRGPSTRRMSAQAAAGTSATGAAAIARWRD